MILAFELNWIATTHVPVNAAMLQIAAQAFPSQRIYVFAEESHLKELQLDSALMVSKQIYFRATKISPYFRGKTHIVSFRRLLRETISIIQGLRLADVREDCLILLLSCSPTAVFVASWLLRICRRGRLSVQIVLHGNLNDINGWRPRNPLIRWFDLVSGLATKHPSRLRFLVLEDAIRDELVRVMPIVGPRVDVLPHPINLGELGERPATELGEPIRVGFVGLATQAKGMDIFLRLARQMKSRYRDRIEFHHVGRVPTDADPSAYSDLSHPISTVPLSRPDFLARLDKLHYVMLPFREGYYNFSASGALIDAITWLKPMIVSRLPLVTRVFGEFGDLGYMFDDDKELEAILEKIMTIDRSRYGFQVQAIMKARASRMPTALAARYKKVISIGYPGLFEDFKNND